MKGDLPLPAFRLLATLPVRTHEKSYVVSGEFLRIDRARLEAMIGTSLLAIDDVRPDLPSTLYHDVLVRRFDEGRVTLCVVASGDARDWSRHYLSVRMSRYREADGLKIVGG